jgi:hypothetical protein
VGLHHFLYRCPLCGHLPLAKRGFQAFCAGCSRIYEQGEEGRVRIHDPEGEVAEVPAAVLAERLDAFGPFSETDAKVMEANVVARVSESEEPIRFRRRLLGYMERQGSRIPGVLRIAGRQLEFNKASGESDVWDFLDIVALQASSSSIQISPRTGGVITFRFSGSSCRRWEEALKSRLRSTWRRAGLGEIAEFQPRIRSW